MKRNGKRYKEEQIIYTLRQVEGGDSCEAEAVEKSPKSERIALRTDSPVSRGQ